MGQYIKSRNEYVIVERFNRINEAIMEAEELSDTQKAYQELMLFGLAKFGAKSPADLSTDQKKEFFKWIGDNWDKDNGKVKDEEIAKKIKKALDKGLIENPEEKAAASGGDSSAEKKKEDIAKEKAKEFEKELEK